MRGVYRGRDATTQLADQSSGALLVLDLLNEDIINAVPGQTSLPAVFSVIPGGTDQAPADRLIVYRQTAPGTEPGVYALCEYGLLKTDAHDGVYQLGRRFARLLNLQSDNDKGQVYILADQIRSLRFELFDGKTWYRGTTPAGSEITSLRISMELPGELWDSKTSVISCSLPVGRTLNMESNNAETYPTE